MQSDVPSAASDCEADSATFLRARILALCGTAQHSTDRHTPLDVHMEVASFESTY